MLSKYPQTPPQQRIMTDPLQPMITEEELDKKHPSTRINHLACLVGLLSIAYGITIVAYSCGARYITLTVFGFIMFILCLVSFYRKQIHKNRVVFYGISAFFIFMTGVTSFVFISQINEQIFCNSQWCHKQVETRDFFEDYLEKKYTSSQLEQKCNDIDAQYNGTMEYEQTGQFLVSEMLIYCKNDPSQCSSTDNMHQHIYWHNLGLTRGMLITLGILEVLYALWLVWWLKYRNPRDDQYAYDSNGNPQPVQLIDANGSMIINSSTIMQQQGLQNTVRNQQLIESRVQQKLNEYQYNNPSGNQSLVNSTRNLNMVKQQDNGLVYVSNNNQSNLQNSYTTPQPYNSNITPYQSNDQGIQIVRKVTQKPLTNNPLKNINQPHQMTKLVESSSPSKIAQQQLNQNIVNPVTSNLNRSLNNGKTHALSSLVGNGSNGGGVLSNGNNVQSIIRKGNLSPLKPFT